MLAEVTFVLNQCHVQVDRKQKSAALLALTAFAAAVLVSAPAQASDDEIKARVCACNPTAAVCLKDSGKK